MQLATSPRLVLLSPLGVIGLGHLTARIAGAALGVWAWIPVLLVFWSTIALLIAWAGGRQAISRWLRPPIGTWAWAGLALLISLVPLGIFIQHWPLLRFPLIFVLWLLFGLINPFLEEGYWRGLLLDAARGAGWPAWTAFLYTSGLFALSHPLMLGVHSAGVRHPAVVVNTFIMGLVWSVLYRRTNSLRWPILSHMIVDFLGLSVPVFLNLYVPPALSR